MLDPCKHLKLSQCLQSLSVGSNVVFYLDGILFKRPAAVKQRKLQIRGVNSVNPDKDTLYSNNKSEEQAKKRWTFFWDWLRWREHLLVVSKGVMHF